jgi:hypothetical protein
MSGILDRLLAARISNGYEAAKSRHLFLDLIDVTADNRITKAQVVVRFPRRARNSLLIAVGSTGRMSSFPGWGISG